MKKIKTTLLFLLLVFGLFAETGYNKNQWRTPKDSIKLLFATTPGEDKRWQTTLAESKTMLGEETKVYYHFYENQLLTVSYNISSSKITTLKSKFKNKVFEIKTISMDKEVYVKSLVENGTLADYQDLNLALNCLLAEATLAYEIEGFQVLKDINYPDGKAKISIYDYNDDTRVCLYENFIDGTVFVIYYFHDQDF